MRQLVGDVEQLAEAVGQVHLSGRALDLRQPLEHFAELRAQHIDIDAGLRKQRAHRPALLVEQCNHQVHRLDHLMVAANSQRLGIRQRFLEFTGQTIHTHGFILINIKNYMGMWYWRRLFQAVQLPLK